MPTREDLENVERYLDRKSRHDDRPWVPERCNYGKKLIRKLLAQPHEPLADDEDTIDQLIEIFGIAAEVEG